MTRFASRMSRIKPSAIRELLKVAERPEVLSFAGGLPAPETFPAAELSRAHVEVLAHDAAAALQYGATEGYGPLREWIAARLGGRGWAVRASQVLITAGSQQGIDLTARALLDPGDVVAVEAPSYLAALQAFDSCEARFAVVGSDEHGMRVDELERLLNTSAVKLVYLVPNFQNPRGVTLSLERRHALARACARHGVTLLEDDPYGELRYSGAALPPVAALDDDASVVYLGSFSKTLAPGLRVGFAVSSEENIRALTVIKQAADLHTGVLAQRAISKLLETFDYEAHLGRLRALYGQRLRAMQAALLRHLPGARCTQPEGGLFIWAQLPGGLDAELLLPEAARERVAFVPGAPFYPARPQRDTLRLNFSIRSAELIDVGMERLGQCVARKLSTAAPEQRAAV